MKSDPPLRTQPWRTLAVFQPVEQMLHRLEMDGTVEAHGRQIVFKEVNSGYYDLPAALLGIVDFHELVAEKYGLPIDVSAMRRFAVKLESGSPIFEADIDQMRACIARCKAQSMKLRVSQAADLVRVIQIRQEMDKRKAA